jgi:hypothetical protein
VVGKGDSGPWYVGLNQPLFCKHAAVTTMFDNGWLAMVLADRKGRA